MSAPIQWPFPKTWPPKPVKPTPDDLGDAPW